MLLHETDHDEGCIVTSGTCDGWGYDKRPWENATVDDIDAIRRAIGLPTRNNYGVFSNNWGHSKALTQASGERVYYHFAPSPWESQTSGSQHPRGTIQGMKGEHPVLEQ